MSYEPHLNWSVWACLQGRIRADALSKASDGCSVVLQFLNLFADLAGISHGL